MVEHAPVLALYFDFDGVLVDSEQLHFACWNDLLAGLGVALPWRTFQQRCVGLSDPATAYWLADHFGGGLTGPELLLRLPEKQACFRQRILAEPPVAVETFELIQSLRHRYPMALVTSSTRSEVEPVLLTTGLADCFQAVVYGDDVTAHKPFPEPYLLAQRRLGVLGGVALEDSAAGQESARKAGLEVLVVDAPGRVAALLERRLGLNERGV